MSKAGRKPIEPTEEDYQQIYQLASDGCNKGQISILLGWAKETFSRKQSEFPRLTQEFEKGRKAGRDDLVKRGLLLENNQAFLIFMLKNMGMSDKKEVEIKDVSDMNDEELAEGMKGILLDAVKSGEITKSDIDEILNKDGDE